MSIYSPENFRLALILGITILAGYGAWQNRPQRGSKTLTTFLVALSITVSAHLASHISPEGLTSVFIKIRWSGLFSLPFLLFTFALAFSNRERVLTRKGIMGILLFPVGIGLFLWLPDISGVFGFEIGSSATASFLAEESALYVFSVGFAYVMLLVSSAVIIYHSYQVHEAFRRQGLILAAGTSLLLTGTAIEVFGLLENLHIHWVQNSFLILGITLLWAIYGEGVTDITPLARSAIFEAHDVAVLVIDHRNNLIDINPAAKKLLGKQETKIVGNSLEDVLSGHSNLLESLKDESDNEIELHKNSERKFVQPSVTSISSPVGKEVGKIVLLYDITEHRRQRQELERQNERLDEFARVVSHDLRNPLTVATGRVDLAADECYSEHLDHAERALNRMETLIDDTLTLAKAGEYIGETESVQLSRLVETCWQTVETDSATLVNITDAMIEADKTRLQQLLENLFRNAVEHGGTGVAIKIGDLSDGFYVEDNGRGIPREERENVLDAGVSTSNEGTGFGLSIVREIAEAHGWAVKVTEGEEGGARFEFTGIESG